MFFDLVKDDPERGALRLIPAMVMVGAVGFTAWWLDLIYFRLLI